LVPYNEDPRTTTRWEALSQAARPIRTGATSLKTLDASRASVVEIIDNVKSRRDLAAGEYEAGEEGYDTQYQGDGEGAHFAEAGVEGAAEAENGYA
jgi:hypothetical protein